MDTCAWSFLETRKATALFRGMPRWKWQHFADSSCATPELSTTHRCICTRVSWPPLTCRLHSILTWGIHGVTRVQVHKRQGQSGSSMASTLRWVTLKKWPKTLLRPHSHAQGLFLQSRTTTQIENSSQATGLIDDLSANVNIPGALYTNNQMGLFFFFFC